MKKKIRAIKVDNKSFNWRAVRGNQSCLLLRVWVNDQKRMPWIEVEYPYKDPWLFIAEAVEAYSGTVEFNEKIFEGITPGKVAEIVRCATSSIGIPNLVSVTHKAQWKNGIEQLSFK